MCLAIPGKIENIDAQRNAQVNFDGVARKVSLRLVPDAKVDDFVLVHAGFAIEIVDKSQAESTQKILEDLAI